jgi:hypothetical protein
MGLDSYWLKLCKPGETAPVITFDPPLNLISGIMSEHGEGSFRGKVYAETIEHLSEISLYQELMENTNVQNIATALEQHIENTQHEPEIESIDPDLKDLARMFRAYGNAGYSLIGWW